MQTTLRKTAAFAVAAADTPTAGVASATGGCQSRPGGWRASGGRLAPAYER